MSGHRCPDCEHPGGQRRRLGTRKPACSCACHQPPPTYPVRAVHAWPSWVEPFEVVS